MSGIVRIRCPFCKEWMCKTKDLCEDCAVLQIRLGEEE